MIILPCSPCKPHEYQDKKYNGKRVHNITQNNAAVCTVCGNKKVGAGKK